MREYAQAVRKLQREATTKVQERAAARLAKAAFDKDTFKGIMGMAGRGGLQKVRNTLTCRYPGQRNSPLLMLGIIGYLESQLFIPAKPSDVEGEEGEPGQDGSLFAVIKDDEEEYSKQILELQKVIFAAVPGFCQSSKNSGKNQSRLISQAHGKAFQLMQLAILHATDYQVAGLEVQRNLFILTDKSAFEDPDEIDFKSGLPYGRDVDILTYDSEGNEVWHEQKSWVAKEGTNQLSGGVKAWQWGSGRNKDANFGEFDEKLQGSAAHRQFILDHIAEELGATSRTVKRVREPSEELIDVDSFEWAFQRFKVKLKSKPDRNNPSKVKIREALKKLPTGKTELLDEHTGIKTKNDMQVDRLNVGGLSALLNKLEQEFKTQVLAELEDSGVDLVAETP